MEDAHTVMLNLPKHTNTAFFGIFDGHSGDLCSHYLASNLYKEVDELTDVFVEAQVAQVCLNVDQSFLDSEEYKHNEDGSACIFSMAQKLEAGKYRTLHANIGDSRTILAKFKGEAGVYEALACTFDHKPTDPLEKARIEAAGGNVTLQRVDGQLALSRAFGDRLLKTPKDAPGEQRKVTSFPDFTSFDATENDFMVLCCDGIFEGEIFERQDLIDWIAKKLESTDDIAKICADLLEECLNRGSHDNMSAMIVQFKNGTEYASDKLEYIPGPWYESEKDAKFQAAYAKDAVSAGYTVEQARAIRKKIEEEKAQTV